MGYSKEEYYTTNDTWTSMTKDDMWYFNLYHCINNCSNGHGDCFFGFCFCHPGYVLAFFAIFCHFLPFFTIFAILPFLSDLESQLLIEIEMKAPINTKRCRINR